MRYAVVLLCCLGCASTAPEADVAPPGEAPAPASIVAEEPDPEPQARSGFPSRPSLEQVLARASTVPLVEAAQALALARQGEVRQASLAPNPRLALSAQRWDPDDFSAGPGRRWIRLYQKFETAGKRGARTEMAEWRVKEANANERVERFRVAEAAAASHQEAAIYQELIEIRAESLETQRALLALRSAQVESGREKEAVLVPLQAAVGELTVRLAQERAQRRAALRRLEGLLALPTGSVEGVEGGLALLERALPPPDGDWAEINPEIAEIRAAEDSARSQIEHARTLGVPDVTIGIGYENLSELVNEPNQTFGLFFDLPLPVFDRNQGGVQAAEAVLRRNAALRQDKIARLSARHAEIRELLIAFRDNRELYAGEIVPARRRDFDIARGAFDSGRLDRVALTEAKLRLLASRAELLAIEEQLTILVLEGLALLGLPPETWD